MRWLVKGSEACDQLKEPMIKSSFGLLSRAMVKLSAPRNERKSLTLLQGPSVVVLSCLATTSLTSLFRGHSGHVLHGREVRTGNRWTPRHGHQEADDLSNGKRHVWILVRSCGARVAQASIENLSSFA